MSAGSWIRCDGCGDQVDDDVLSPPELRDAMQQERGWVFTAAGAGVLDQCPKPECADEVAVKAGVR